MATPTQEQGIDPGVMTSRMMAQFIHAYMECSDAVQGVIRDMAAIYNDPDSDEDEKAMALSTIAEAAFPPRYSGRLGVDMDGEDRHAPAYKEASARLDAEERHFADRLRAAMEAKGISQSALAEAVGINQSAISNLLSRRSRPQQRTVAKFADALGISPADLWPTASGSA